MIADLQFSREVVHPEMMGRLAVFWIKRASVPGVAVPGQDSGKEHLFHWAVPDNPVVRAGVP
jgi:hypothetical protein